MPVPVALAGPDPLAGGPTEPAVVLGLGVDAGCTSASTSTWSVPILVSCPTTSRRRTPTWAYTAKAEPSGAKLAGPVTTVRPRVGENHWTPATMVGLALALASADADVDCRIGR